MAWIGPAIGAGISAWGASQNGGGSSQEMEPWGPAQPGLEYGIGQTINLFNNSGWTPEMQFNVNNAVNNGQHFLNNTYGNNYIPNLGRNLGLGLINGQYNFNPNAPQSIASPTVDPTFNGFQSNSQAQGYNAAQMGPVGGVSAQQIDPTQFLNTPQVNPQNMGAAHMNSASMNAAHNSGYTPTGQVAEFMNGEAYNNPMLDGMYDAAARRVTDTFNEDVMPEISKSAVANGGFGGSRQGIAEGLAAKEAHQGLTDLASDIYGNAYNLGFGAMSDLTARQMQGGIDASAQNANLQQGANQNNAGWQQQANATNAGFNQQANLTNANNNLAGQLANQSAGMQGMGMSLNAQQSNQGANLSGQTTNANNQFRTGLANMGALNNAGQFNASNNTQNNQFNTGLNAAVSQNNANTANNMGQFNASNNIWAQGQNANNQLTFNNQLHNASQQNLMNQLGGFNALNLGMGAANAATGNQLSMMQAPDLYKWWLQGQYNSNMTGLGGMGYSNQGSVDPSALNRLGQGLGIYEGLEDSGMIDWFNGVFNSQGSNTTSNSGTLGGIDVSGWGNG